jgi:hypothetical protein
MLGLHHGMILLLAQRWAGWLSNQDSRLHVFGHPSKIQDQTKIA